MAGAKNSSWTHGLTPDVRGPNANGHLNDWNGKNKSRAVMAVFGMFPTCLGRHVHIPLFAKSTPSLSACRPAHGGQVHIRAESLNAHLDQLEQHAVNAHTVSRCGTTDRCTPTRSLATPRSVVLDCMQGKPPRQIPVGAYRCPGAKVPLPHSNLIPICCGCSAATKHTGLLCPADRQARTSDCNCTAVAELGVGNTK